MADTQPSPELLMRRASVAASVRKWRAAHREADLASKRAWRESHKVEQAQYFRAYWARKRAEKEAQALAAPQNFEVIRVDLLAMLEDMMRPRLTS